MIDAIISASEAYQILEKSLNAASTQHKMISNNIANVDTPGFKGSEVVFQSKLQQVLNNREKSYLQLNVTHPNHIPLTPELSITELQPEVMTRTESTARNDGNNVDIDAEMARLAENTVYYTTVAQLLTGKLNTLRSVINDGRR
jgi:flagellar basal-body rod protein FlgB